jgi:hypothetical protein
MKLRQLCFASLLIVFVATTLSLCSPLAYAQAPSLPGQQQYYSVYLRGNGEAVVSLKVEVVATPDTSLSSITLGAIPDDASDITAYQILNQSKPCVYPLPMDATPKQPERMPDENNVMFRYPCETYGQSYPYWQGANTYSQATFTKNEDSLVIQLPNPTYSNSTARVLLTYRTFSYVNKTLFGAYSYNFKTLSAKESVQNIQVGVSTENDFKMRDALGTVDYARSMTTRSIPPSNIAAGEVQNSVMDSYASQIGYGMLQRSSSNLAPGETFAVKGMYANAGWKLYAKELLGALLGGIVLLLILGFVGKKLYRMGFAQKDITTKKISSVQQLFLISLGISFVTSLLVSGLSVFLFFSSRFLNILMPYYYSGQMVLIMLIAIIAVSLYGLLLLAPAIFWGIKRGVWWGVGVFGMTIAWLMAAVVFALVVSYIFFGRNPVNMYPPQPMPGLMMRGGSIDASQSSTPTPEQFQPRVQE